MLHAQTASPLYLTLSALSIPDGHKLIRNDASRPAEIPHRFGSQSPQSRFKILIFRHLAHNIRQTRQIIQCNLSAHNIQYPEFPGRPG